MEKRYALLCTHPVLAGEMLTFETDERGAVIARAYKHIEDGCAVRVLDRHTNTEIEL